MKMNLSKLAYSKIKEMITHEKLPIGQVVSVIHLVELWYFKSKRIRRSFNE